MTTTPDSTEPLAPQDAGTLCDALTAAFTRDELETVSLCVRAQPEHPGSLVARVYPPSAVARVLESLSKAGMHHRQLPNEGSEALVLVSRPAPAAQEPDGPCCYDSRPATLLHSLRVGALMVEMMQEGMHRAVRHDLSKTEPPEVEAFDRMTPALKQMEYGTPEYKASLESLAPALRHHYAKNRHHPEHHARGVNGMTLVDLMEMLADWKASTERMAAGDLRRSIALNMERFGIGEQLAAVLLSTAERFGWISPLEEDEW